ncbi:MAG: DCC1-like thiol-disulfide oxidoreductase family protein [Halobacteriota archaeon]
MSDYDSILVYDGECPYCSIAAKALGRLDDVGAISWYDDAAQSFLRAQFDATPFAMVLVDDSKKQVYAGRKAAEELAERAGMPGLVSLLVRTNYERIASLVGTASGRARDPDDVHEVYPTTPAAADLFDALVANAADPPESLLE